MFRKAKGTKLCSSLERLLGSAAGVQFFTTIYEKTFLHVSGRSRHYFHDLFALNVAEELLWSHESYIRDFVRFHNDGRDIVTPSDVGRLDVANWAFAEYGRGATIIMNALEDYHLPLARFVRDLEIFLEARVSAAAYLTPTGARAFRVHFDTHDVLIAQVEGSKVYDLFADPATPPLPLRRQQAEVDAKSLDKPLETVRLEAGDVLYIPRGMVHVAKTAGDYSLHLTFSLHPPKISDLATTAIELAAEANPALRGSLFEDFGEQNLTAFVAALGDALGVSLTLEHLLVRQRQRFVGRLRPLPSQRLQAGPAASTLSGDDWMEKSTGSVCSIMASDTSVRLGFPGLGVIRDDTRSPTHIEMPAAVEPVIRFIEAQEGAFQISTLPGPLSEASKLILARYLLREGLLQLRPKKD